MTPLGGDDPAVTSELSLVTVRCRTCGTPLGAVVATVPLPVVEARIGSSRSRSLARKLDEIQTRGRPRDDWASPLRLDRTSSRGLVSLLTDEAERVRFECGRCEAPRWVWRSKLIAEAEAFKREGTTKRQTAFGRIVRAVHE